MHNTSQNPAPCDPLSAQDLAKKEKERYEKEMAKYKGK